MRALITLAASAFFAVGVGGCTYEHHDHRPPTRVVEYYRVDRVDEHHGYWHQDRHYRDYRDPDCR